MPRNRTCRFDVLDLNMPDMHGMEVIGFAEVRLIARLQRLTSSGQYVAVAGGLNQSR